ncbi:MAG TPA: DUF2752 domain-containing protein [Thermoanaerobaculia bacterium]|nr:DUF2752 domain-containing protein [Thermoanaerobaculia bacterium]
MLTSMPCPTCGTTRGLFALLHGDVRLAMQSNPLSFLVPLIVLRRGFVLTTYGTRCSALFNHQAIDRTLMASFFAIALLHYLFVALPAAIR